jgi:hypothetical protein
MMRARAKAVAELEKAVSHDWRRLVAGTASLVLVLVGELVLAVVGREVAEMGWDLAATVLIIAAVLSLASGAGSGFARGSGGVGWSVRWSSGRS